MVTHAVALRNSKVWGDFQAFGLRWVPQLVSSLNSMAEYAPEAHFPGLAEYPIGKLGTKQEPGKVRVFAMVDW